MSSNAKAPRQRPENIEIYNSTRSLRPLQKKTNRSGLIHYRYAFRIFREIAVDNPQELIMNRGLGYGIV